jgi:hypothetical protein
VGSVIVRHDEKNIWARTHERLQTADLAKLMVHGDDGPTKFADLKSNDASWRAGGGEFESRRRLANCKNKKRRLVIEAAFFY